MSKACFLCKSKEKNDVKFGEFMTRGKLSVHYFCLLLTSNLMQNGRDNEGFLGFMPKDIQTEAERVKPAVCCYCRQPSANISCCASRCHKSFHLICGEKNSTEHEFVGTFKSYCNRHVKGKKVTRPLPDEKCCICYENIFCLRKKFDTVKMIRAPCCKNGWFHKFCLASFAKTAGYFFKCPLCNDCKVFRQRLPYKGIFIPDRDAEWELEPNAFAELLERPKTCSAKICCAEGGRGSLNTEFLFCSTCGSSAIHRRCMIIQVDSFSCNDCATFNSSVQTVSLVNISSSQQDKHDSGDEEDGEEIDVGEEFDFASIDKSQTQTGFEDDATDETGNPLNTESKKLNIVVNDMLCFSDDEKNNKANCDLSNENFKVDIIKPVQIINEYSFTIADLSTKSLNDDLVLNKQRKRLLSDDLSEIESTSKSCKRQKLLTSSESEIFRDSGSENFRSESTRQNCKKRASVNSPSDVLEKFDLHQKAFVRVKKIENLEIGRRVNRRFISLNGTNKNNIKCRPKRSHSECIETFFKCSEKQEGDILKSSTIEQNFSECANGTMQFEKDTVFEGKLTCSRKSDTKLSTHSFRTTGFLNSFDTAIIATKKSVMRLRARSEEFSRMPLLAERRRSFIQSSFATLEQQTTERSRTRRISESIPLPSIKRNHVQHDFKFDYEHYESAKNCSNNTFLYKNENTCKQLTGLRRHSSRGRSPLSANLYDVYAYITPYAQKVVADKSAVTGNFLNLKPNMPEVENLSNKSEQTKDTRNLQQSIIEKSKSDTQTTIISDSGVTTDQNRAVVQTKSSCFGFLFARDKSKTLKHKKKRIFNQKFPKQTVLSGTQTKIESFFKRM